MAKNPNIAETRIYGTTADGKNVLVAAEGQPIPPGWDIKNGVAHAIISPPEDMLVRGPAQAHVVDERTYGTTVDGTNILLAAEGQAVPDHLLELLPEQEASAATDAESAPKPRAKRGRPAAE